MRNFLFTVSLLVLSLGVSASDGAAVYVALNQPSASDTIEAANLDGTGYSANFINLGLGFAPQGIVVTPDNTQLFWSDNTNSTVAGIYTRGVGGGTVSKIVNFANGTTATGMAVDSVASRLYWTNSLAPNKGIWRSDLSGNNQTKLVDTSALYGTGSLPSYLTLDVPTSKMFWTDFGTDTIYSANLDGTSPTALVASGGSAPRGIATFAGKVYWVDGGSDFLYRVDQDGSNFTPLLNLTTVNSTSNANGLTIANGKLLWTDFSGIEGVYSANLDGSGAALLFATTASGIPVGITAVPDPSSLHLLTLASGLGGLLVWWKRR